MLFVLFVEEKEMECDAGKEVVVRGSQREIIGGEMTTQSTLSLS